MTAVTLATEDPSTLLLRAGDAVPARPLVDVQGSKNCFNHLGALAFAGDGLQLRLDGAPRISDRETVARILVDSGVDALQVGDALLSGGRPTSGYVHPDDGRRLRVSICYAAALAANIGWAVCPHPGGDAFTRRPIDLHLRVLRAAGGECVQSPDGEFLSIRFPSRPRAFDLRLRTRFGPSMGASVTALLVAAQASGVSTLRGLCPEPEVGGVVAALRALGVPLHEVDRDVLRVHGVDGPLSGTLQLTIPPDRIEAATYLIIGALRQPETAVAGIGVQELPRGLRQVFHRLGLQLRQDPGADGRPVTTARRSALRPVQLVTGPHPQFPTDVQPQMAALLTQADGYSSVTERVYASRVTHVGELARLGLWVGVDGSRQLVPGRQRARGGHALVHDVRCGAALLVAAAAADGPVLLHDPAGHLGRGYADLRTKLAQVGMHLTARSAPSAVPAPVRPAGRAERGRRGT